MAKPAAPFTIDRYVGRISKDPDGCWQWVGIIRPDGYGSAYDPRIDNQRRAHRIVYELLVGPIPVGLQLDHLCRNRRCVNPDHLEPVEQVENLRRGQEAVKDACTRGHRYTPETLYLQNGARTCRVCQALRQRVRRADRLGDHSAKAEADRLAWNTGKRNTGRHSSVPPSLSRRSA